MYRCQLGGRLPLVSSEQRLCELGSCTAHVISRKRGTWIRSPLLGEVCCGKTEQSFHTDCSDALVDFDNTNSYKLHALGETGFKFERLIVRISCLDEGRRVLLGDAAKNVILAGVKAVTLHDKADVTLRDLSAQFYLTEEDVGKNRAEACQARLQELNIAVAVSASTDDLSEDFLGRFEVLFLTLQQGVVVEQ